MTMSFTILHPGKEYPTTVIQYSKQQARTCTWWTGMESIMFDWNLYLHRTLQTLTLQLERYLPTSSSKKHLKNTFRTHPTGTLTATQPTVETLERRNLQLWESTNKQVILIIKADHPQALNNTIPEDHTTEVPEVIRENSGNPISMTKGTIIPVNLFSPLRIEIGKMQS